MQIVCNLSERRKFHVMVKVILILLSLKLQKLKMRKLILVSWKNRQEDVLDHLTDFTLIPQPSLANHSCTEAAWETQTILPTSDLVRVSVADTWPRPRGT